MARLPEPGKDNGTWGAILNDYLTVAHTTDGSIKFNSISEAHLSGAVRTKLNTAIGEQGPKGDQGDPGPAGPKGDPGEPGGGSVSYDTLPAGTTLSVVYSGTSWPARPTARTDIFVHWIGANESTPPTGAVAGVDLWDRPTA